jgi:hypothetical protein
MPDRGCAIRFFGGSTNIIMLIFSFGFYKGYTRVYLLASLQISRALPTFIVDYAADRAMPRATTWLKPEVEGLAKSWLDN